MPQKVLVIETGIFHPSIFAQKNLNKLLSSNKEITPEYTSSINNLIKLDSGNYAGVIIYLHRKEISNDAINSLDNFVKNGGGFTGLHSASASFKKYERYFDILGGRFINHGAVGDFDIIQNQEEPASREIFGSHNQLTIKDELYIHDYDKSNIVHFYTVNEGNKEPQVWTRNYGKGKVFYFSPGHLAPTMINPTIKDIITKGLLWTIKR